MEHHNMPGATVEKSIHVHTSVVTKGVQLRLRNFKDID